MPLRWKINMSCVQNHSTVLTMRQTSFRLALTVTLVVTMLLQPFSVRAEDDQHEAFYFHSPVPLGVDSIRLMPSKKVVYLLASAENQTLDGLHVERGPHVGRVARVDGTDVKTYPEALDFRVTATSLPNEFQ